MVRLLDKSLDGDCRDSGELFWQFNLCSVGAHFSTVAVIDKNAVLQERVSYTSYGVGTHRWPHEVNKRRFSLLDSSMLKKSKTILWKIIRRMPLATTTMILLCVFCGGLLYWQHHFTADMDLVLSSATCFSLRYLPS